jgi:hypothetical protein
MRRRKRLSILISASSLALCIGIACIPNVRSLVWPTEPLTSAETDNIFLPLHRNIYAAMQFSSDEQIYDALAKSVDGEMLTTVYRQLHRNLAMKDQGGAVARVDDVLVADAEIVDARVTDAKAIDGRPSDEESQSRKSHPRWRRAFQYRCRWEVAGTVEHWGHLHKRRQAHKALFTVEATDGYWKIVDWDLIDEQLLESTVAVREVSPVTPRK